MRCLRKVILNEAIHSWLLDRYGMYTRIDYDWNLGIDSMIWPLNHQICSFVRIRYHGDHVKIQTGPSRNITYRVDLGDPTFFDQLAKEIEDTILSLKK